MWYDLSFCVSRRKQPGGNQVPSHWWQPAPSTGVDNTIPVV